MRTGAGSPGLRNDILAGCFFIAIGVITFVLSWGLEPGSTSQPGSGYLPRIIALLLSGLGAAIIVNDLLGRGDGEVFLAPRLRPFLAIVGILGFGLLIEPLGFLLSAAFLIVMALAAYGRIRILEFIALATVLITACILVFIVGLGQRIPLLP